MIMISVLLIYMLDASLSSGSNMCFVSSLKCALNYVGVWSLLCRTGMRCRVGKSLPAENSLLHSFALSVKYGAHYLNWPFLVFVAFYAKDAVREPRCLGPLLPTVINKDVQLDIHQVRSQLLWEVRIRAERREWNQAQMYHCYSCKESQDPVHKSLNWTHRTGLLEMNTGVLTIIFGF